MSLNKIDLQNEDTRNQVIEHFDKEFTDINSDDFQQILKILKANDSDPKQENLGALFAVITKLDPTTSYIDTNSEYAILKIQDKIRDLIDFYFDTKLQTETHTENKEAIISMVTKFKTDTKLNFRNVYKDDDGKLFFENDSHGVFSNKELKRYNISIDKKKTELTEAEKKEYERYTKQLENKELFNEHFNKELVKTENELVEKIQNYVYFNRDPQTEDEDFKKSTIKLFIPDENQIITETQKAVFCHIFQVEEMDEDAIESAKGRIQAMIDTVRLQIDPAKNEKLGYFKKVSAQDTVENFMSEEKNYGVFKLTDNIIDEISQMDWIKKYVHDASLSEQENQTRLLKHMILAIKYNGTRPPNNIRGLSYLDDLMSTYNFIRMKLGSDQEIVKILQALNVYLDDLEEDPKIHVTYFDGEGWKKDERDSTTLSSDDEVRMLSKHNREMYKKYTDKVKINAEKFYGKDVKVNSVAFENKLYKDFKILCETYGGLSGRTFEEAKDVFEKINKELEEKIRDKKFQDDIEEAKKIIDKNLDKEGLRGQAMKQFLAIDDHKDELDSLIFKLDQQNSKILEKYQEKLKKFKETEGANIKKELLDQEKTNPILIKKCKQELEQSFQTNLEDKIKQKIKTDKQTEINAEIDEEIKQKLLGDKYNEAFKTFYNKADAETGEKPWDVAYNEQEQLVKNSLSHDTKLIASIRKELYKKEIDQLFVSNKILNQNYEKFVHKHLEELYTVRKNSIKLTQKEFVDSLKYSTYHDMDLVMEFLGTSNNPQIDEIKEKISQEKILEEALKRHLEEDDNQEKLNKAIENKLKEKFDKTEEAKALTLENIKASTDDVIKNKIKEITEKVTNEFVKANKEQTQNDLETEFRASLEANTIIKAKSKVEEADYFTNNLQEKFKKALDSKFREALQNGIYGKKGFSLLDKIKIYEAQKRKVEKDYLASHTDEIDTILENLKTSETNKLLALQAILLKDARDSNTQVEFAGDLIDAMTDDEIKGAKENYNKAMEKEIQELYKKQKIDEAQQKRVFDMMYVFEDSNTDEIKNAYKYILEKEYRLQKKVSDYTHLQGKAKEAKEAKENILTLGIGNIERKIINDSERLARILIEDVIESKKQKKAGNFFKWIGKQANNFWIRNTATAYEMEYSQQIQDLFVALFKGETLNDGAKKVLKVLQKEKVLPPDSELDKFVSLYRQDLNATVSSYLEFDEFGNKRTDFDDNNLEKLEEEFTIKINEATREYFKTGNKTKLALTIDQINQEIKDKNSDKMLQSNIIDSIVEARKKHIDKLDKLDIENFKTKVYLVDSLEGTLNTKQEDNWLTQVNKKITGRAGLTFAASSVLCIATCFGTKKLVRHGLYWIPIVGIGLGAAANGAIKKHQEANKLGNLIDIEIEGGKYNSENDTYQGLEKRLYRIFSQKSKGFSYNEIKAKALGFLEEKTENVKPQELGAVKKIHTEEDLIKKFTELNERQKREYENNDDTNNKIDKQIKYIAQLQARLSFGKNAGKGFIKFTNAFSSNHEELQVKQLISKMQEDLIEKVNKNLSESDREEAIESIKERIKSNRHNALSILGQSLHDEEKAFKKLKTAEAVKGAAVGAVAGLAIGGVMSWLSKHAMDFTQNSNWGIFEKLGLKLDLKPTTIEVDGENIQVDLPEDFVNAHPNLEFDSFNDLNETLINNDLSPIDSSQLITSTISSENMNEIMVGGDKFKIPQDVLDRLDHADLANTDTFKEALLENGYNIDEMPSTETITETVSGMAHGTNPLNVIPENNKVEINHMKFFDYGTHSETQTEINENHLHYIFKNGKAENFTIKEMFHNHSSCIDSDLSTHDSGDLLGKQIQEAAQHNKLFLGVKLNDAGNTLVKIPIDANGNTNIDFNDPQMGEIYKQIFDKDSGLSDFKGKYLAVMMEGKNNGNVNVLASIRGNNSVSLGGGGAGSLTREVTKHIIHPGTVNALRQGAVEANNGFIPIPAEYTRRARFSHSKAYEHPNIKPVFEKEKLEEIANRPHGTNFAKSLDLKEDIKNTYVDRMVTREDFRYQIANTLQPDHEKLGKDLSKDEEIIGGNIEDKKKEIIAPIGVLIKRSNEIGYNLGKINDGVKEKIKDIEGKMKPDYEINDVIDTNKDFLNANPSLSKEKLNNLIQGNKIIINDKQEIVGLESEGNDFDKVNLDTLTNIHTLNLQNTEITGKVPSTVIDMSLKNIKGELDLSKAQNLKTLKIEKSQHIILKDNYIPNSVENIIIDNGSGIKTENMDFSGFDNLNEFNAKIANDLNKWPNSPTKLQRLTIRNSINIDDLSSLNSSWMTVNVKDFRGKTQKLDINNHMIQNGIIKDKIT